MSEETINLVKIVYPYVLGAIGGIGSVFLTGFAKEVFDKRARIDKHKLNVAKHVLEICNEASTNHFAKAPRDMEHVHSVLTNVEGLDKEIETVMNSFVSKWQMLITMKNTKGLGNDEEKYTAELMAEVEKNRKIVVEWANKIRVGK